MNSNPVSVESSIVKVEFEILIFSIPTPTVLLSCTESFDPAICKSPRSEDPDTDDPSIVNVSPETVAVIPPVPTKFSVDPSAIEMVDDVVSPNDIIKLPLHGREEVCLIASRKILGATADETYQVGASEIQQLKGK